jgi:hypothetical protein
VKIVSVRILVIGASGLLARPVISQFTKGGFQFRFFSGIVNQSIFEKRYGIVNSDSYLTGFFK